MDTVFIHPERCIGCKQCEIACAVAHSQTKNIYQAVFETPPPRSRIHAEPGMVVATSFPNRCRHCDPAPCMGACPTAAISRSEDHPEIVLIEPEKCIACGMCAMVCPFDVITYYNAAESAKSTPVAIKCDNCIDRQREGKIPACVEVCKVNALVFGDINEVVKSARTEYSEKVSVAVGQIEPEITGYPSQLQAWRSWGKAVTNLNLRDGKGE